MRASVLGERTFSAGASEPERIGAEGGGGGIKITCRILVVRSESVRKAFDYKRTHTAHIVCAILLEMRYCKYDFFAPPTSPRGARATCKCNGVFIQCAGEIHQKHRASRDKWCLFGVWRPGVAMLLSPSPPMTPPMPTDDRIEWQIVLLAVQQRRGVEQINRVRQHSRVQLLANSRKHVTQSWTLISQTLRRISFRYVLYGGQSDMCIIKLEQATGVIRKYSQYRNWLTLWKQ